LGKKKEVRTDPSRGVGVFPREGGRPEKEWANKIL